MICPVCKSPMIVVEYQQIELDYCPECSGVWFDAGELELLLEKAGLEGAELAQPLADLAEASSGEKKRRCPICSRRMKKILVGREPKVLIDACPDEDGLWFDGGEVEELISQLSVERVQSSDSEEQVSGFLKNVFGGKRQD